MNTLISQSELNLALRNLLEALKDYNRALVMANQRGDELVSQLIGQLASDYHDCKLDEYGTGHCEHQSHFV